MFQMMDPDTRAMGRFMDIWSRTNGPPPIRNYSICSGWGVFLVVRPVSSIVSASLRDGVFLEVRGFGPPLASSPRIF